MIVVQIETDKAKTLASVCGAQPRRLLIRLQLWLMGLNSFFQVH